MGKKKTSGQHATKSFEQLVGEANRNALKPYIHEVFGDMANDLSRRIFRQQANIQTRIMAVEKILSDKFQVSEDEIQNAVMDIEDDATGYQTAARAAVAGDLLRVSIRTRAKDAADWTDTQRRQVTNLLNAGMPAGAPLSLGSAQVEGALVGMTAGEAKTVILEDDFQVELYVDRVSEKIKKAVLAPAPAPAQEGTQNENQNA